MNELTEQQIIEKTIRVETQHDADIWNAAIELAAKMAEDKGLVGMARLAYEIRGLKK